MSAGASAVLRAMLDKGFVAKAELDDATWDTYLVFFAGVDHEELAAAVQQLAARGHRHRPKPPEILAEVRADRDQPTWPEAYELIYGSGGLVRSADPNTAAARLERAHPVLQSFVRVQTLDRLRTLPLFDPEWGGAEHRRLEQRWERHVERCEARMLEGRTLDLLEAPSGDGPRRLDPLKAIAPPARELEAEVA